MNKIKYIAGIIGFLALVFFLLGGFNKSVEIKHEIIIKSPVKTVFTTVVDPRKMREWIKNLERIEPVNGSFQDPGTIYLISLNYGKRKYRILSEIIAFEWYRELGLVLYPRQIKVELHLLFEERKTETRILLDSKISGTGLFSRSVLIFYKFGIKKSINNSFINLKEILEDPSLSETVDASEF